MVEDIIISSTNSTLPTEWIDVILLDVKRPAAERYLVDDDREAVDVARLCSRYVRVT